MGPERTKCMMWYIAGVGPLTLLGALCPPAAIVAAPFYIAAAGKSAVRAAIKDEMEEEVMESLKEAQDSERRAWQYSRGSDRHFETRKSVTIKRNHPLIGVSGSYTFTREDREDI